MGWGSGWEWGLQRHVRGGLICTEWLLVKLWILRQFKGKWDVLLKLEKGRALLCSGRNLVTCRNTESRDCGMNQVLGSGSPSTTSKVPVLEGRRINYGKAVTKRSQDRTVLKVLSLKHLILFFIFLFLLDLFGQWFICVVDLKKKKKNKTNFFHSNSLNSASNLIESFHFFCLTLLFSSF